MSTGVGREWASAAAGVVFATLFVAGLLLIGDLGGSYGDPDTQFADLHASAANRTRYILGGYLLSAAAIAFVWFIVPLTHRLTTQERLSVVTTARISGTVFATVLLASAASFMAAAGSITFGEALGDGGQFEAGISVLPQLGYALFGVGGTLAASSTIVAVSLLIREKRRSHMLLRRGGYVTALLLPTGVIMSASLALLPLWAVAVSLVILRQADPAVLAPVVG